MDYLDSKIHFINNYLFGHRIAIIVTSKNQIISPLLDESIKVAVTTVECATDEDILTFTFNHDLKIILSQ